MAQNALEEEDDDDEEEEEDASNIATQHPGKRQAAGLETALRPPTPIYPPSTLSRTSPVSSAAPQTLRGSSVMVSVSAAPSTSRNIGKVRVIKQWTPDTTWAPTAKT